MLESRQGSKIRFGVFELDSRTGELRKSGTRIRLQELPLKVLLALLEQPGDVITRDELKRRIWPDAAFGDFDHAVNVAVGKLRAALCDSAEAPRFVETLPRRGYRFVFPVDLPPEDSAAFPVGEVLKPSRKPLRLNTVFISVATLVVVAGTTISAWWFGFRKPRVPTVKDTIVVADFTNSTGDPIFDGTLREGLSVQLEQSPFLSILSDRRTRQTLQMMKQQPDAKLTPAISREICRRVNSVAVIEGSIVQIGAKYDVVLKVEDCLNGELVASSQAYASDKNKVLAALGKASSEIRKKLGESLASVKKFDTPIEQATTSSLEALQTYDLGYKVGDSGNYAAAIPPFERALGIDPNFAMAHVLLGMMQWNLTQQTSARAHLQKGFDLRATVSEREKLFIELEYYSVNDTGDYQNAKQTAALWAQRYPKDCAPRGEAGALYDGLEQYDKALAEYRAAYQLCPDDSLVSAALVSNYIFLDRLKEARAIANDAKVRNPDSFELRPGLYLLAFLQNDAAEMQQQVDFATGKPGLEDRLFFDESNTAAYLGRFKESREFSRRAVLSAQRAHEFTRAVSDAEVAALRDALAGNKKEARRQLWTALRLPAAEDDLFNKAIVFAMLGDSAGMKPFIRGLENQSHSEDYVRFIQLPLLAALTALNRKDAPKAIELLSPVPYESRFAYSPNSYYRGLAYLANHQGHEAAVEFQRILDHRGVVGNWIEGALARLGLARGHALSGDTAKSRAAYNDFFTLWKDADPDIPVLQQAKTEFLRLQ